MALLRHLLAFVVLMIVIGMIASVASALPDPGENGTTNASDRGVGGEKSVSARTPAVSEETPVPEETDEKIAAQKEPDILVAGETTPPAEEALKTTEPTAAITPSPNATTLSGFTGATIIDDNETVDAEAEETLAATSSQNATNTTEPAEIATESDDDTDDEEEVEEEPTATSTLEKYAPPRPSATMAKAHQSHDRPLVQSDHPLVNPGTSYTPEEDENETRTPAPVAVARDGLLVKGVGVILDRTPEDVALTRSGVEIANLGWLLDPAMLLGGRHPRAVFEGETFTVTVTVEARNLTATGDNPAYVVLVPPPGETGVYEITRTSESPGLGDGERGVWEFSVATHTGRLTLANLTLPEERLVTNLTSNPDLFAFRAYALAGDQEVPSTGVSDPVLAIRPDGDVGEVEAPPLPELYALAGVPDSTLKASETMAGAWARGVDNNEIVAGAVGHLETLSGLEKEEIAAVYDLQGGGEGGGQSTSSPSLLDLIMEFFRGLLG